MKTTSVTGSIEPGQALPPTFEQRFRSAGSVGRVLVLLAIAGLVVKRPFGGHVRFATRRARPALLAFVLIAALGGCSGSGDPPRTDPPQPIGNTPPPTGGGDPPLPTSNPATAGGHWWGSLSRGDEVVSEAFCLLVEAGELACVLFERSDVFLEPPYLNRVVGAVQGDIQVSSTTQATGSGKIYATPGNVLTDGSSIVADFTITGGSLNADDYYGEYGQLELTFTSLGEEYTFHGYFDHYYAVYGQNTLIWPVEGAYTTFDIYGDPASLSIDPNGGLFMQSASGCSGNGTMARVGPPLGPGVKAYNAHNVELTVSDCAGFDGSYEGMATLIDFAWVNGTDNLVIAVFSDTTAIVGEAVK